MWFMLNSGCLQGRFWGHFGSQWDHYGYKVGSGDLWDRSLTDLGVTLGSLGILLDDPVASGGEPGTPGGQRTCPGGGIRALCGGSRKPRRKVTTLLTAGYNTTNLETVRLTGTSRFKAVYLEGF